jgi:hypothetical protein
MHPNLRAHSAPRPVMGSKGWLIVSLLSTMTNNDRPTEGMIDSFARYAPRNASERFPCAAPRTRLSNRMERIIPETVQATSPLPRLNEYHQR